TDTHDLWSNTCRGKRDESAPRLPATLLSDCTRCDDDGCSAVTHLRRVACGDRSILQKCRLQLTESFFRCISTRAFIPVQVYEAGLLLPFCVQGVNLNIQSHCLCS